MSDRRVVIRVREDHIVEDIIALVASDPLRQRYPMIVRVPKPQFNDLYNRLTPRERFVNNEVSMRNLVIGVAPLTFTVDEDEFVGAVPATIEMACEESMFDEPVDRRAQNMEVSEVRRYLNEIRMPSSMCNTIEALIQYRERTVNMSDGPIDYEDDPPCEHSDDIARELGLE